MSNDNINTAWLDQIDNSPLKRGLYIKNGKKVVIK